MITFRQLFACALLGLLIALATSSAVSRTMDSTSSVSGNMTLTTSSIDQLETSSSISTSYSNDNQTFAAITQSGCAAEAGDASECDDIDDDYDGRQKIPLYLGVFFAMGKNGNWDGSGFLPAIELGLEHVNERPGLLDDYELRMEWVDSEVCSCATHFHAPLPYLGCHLSFKIKCW